MIAPIWTKLEGSCTFERHVPAWAFGTGLRVALAPGEYRITGQDEVNGVIYLRLDDSYRIDSREIAR